MTVFSGYQILETLFENPNTQVLRVKADPDGRIFIIKTTRDDHPPVEITERLIREYDMIRGLDVEGVVKTVDFKRQGHQPLFASGNLKEILPFSKQ